ncbi:MAG: T9SS C-terminal target domain-containing protein, partial [Bacteroidia bacterium]|nr:T9SS C-terminal target domain-containing protein [Bacteroidia bacterium]
NALFGGNDPHDDSGIIKYVRIEFAGIEFVTFQEINGLTLAGVGDKTVVEYVQSSYSGDDAFECFGGTVNAKYLVAFRTWDDDFDSDLGYSGKMQFLVGLRDPMRADISNSNGIESDNDPNGTASQPFTQPVFSNVSLFGPLPDASYSNQYDTQHRRGVWIQNRSKASVFNSVVAGWPVSLQIDGRYTAESARNGEIVFRNNVLAGVRKDEAHYGFYYSIPSSQFDVKAWAAQNAVGCDTFDLNAEVKIADPFNLENPRFTPSPQSPALTGADFGHPKLQDPFFERVSFRGAFGNEDWTSGWTNFDPQNTKYE